MRKFLRSKLLISLLLLIVAGVLAFVALPNLYESQSSTIEVVEFIDDVVVGTQIKESMLTTKTVGGFGIDGSVIKNKADIVGLYAGNDIRRETLLYSDQFVQVFEEADGAVDTLIGPNDKLITLRLASAAAGGGGMIKSGQFVDVYSQKIEGEDTGYEDMYYSGEDKIEMELLPLLSKVRVYCLQNNALENIADLQREWKSLLEKDDGSEEDFDSSMIPVYVTLIVSDEQALELTNQEYSGTVHLVAYPSSHNKDNGKKVSVTDTVDNAPVVDETIDPAGAPAQEAVGNTAPTVEGKQGMSVKNGAQG